MLREQLAAMQQALQHELTDQKLQLDRCAAAAASALGKSEDLRQGAVVLSGRLDAVPGQIKAAVEPVSFRCDGHAFLKNVVHPRFGDYAALVTMPHS